MRRRFVRAAMLLAIAAGSGAGVRALAVDACAGYTVTAPVVGTKTDSECTPPVGPQNHTVGGSNCQGVPPAGVTVCVRATTHPVLP